MHGVNAIDSHQFFLMKRILLYVIKCVIIVMDGNSEVMKCYAASVYVKHEIKKNEINTFTMIKAKHCKIYTPFMRYSCTYRDQIEL